MNQYACSIEETFLQDFLEIQKENASEFLEDSNEMIHYLWWIVSNEKITVWRLSP